MRTSEEEITRRPQALAQLPDWPEQEEAKLGSLREDKRLNGVGALGFGW
jgi:hypothetical protein